MSFSRDTPVSKVARLAVWLSHRVGILLSFALPRATTPNLLSVARVSEAIEDVRGDVRDYDHIESSLRDFAPELSSIFSQSHSCGNHTRNLWALILSMSWGLPVC